MKQLLFRTLYGILIFLGSTPIAEAQICGPNVPAFTVDLSNDPSAIYFSPDTVRDDTCCGVTVGDKCIEFAVTLHPDAGAIIFDIFSGTLPVGALFYQNNCGNTTPVGDPLCLSGVGPHLITFCKPGTSQNVYSITSVPKPGVGPPIVVNDGCIGQIHAIGYKDTTTTWTSVFPGSLGDFDSFLSCTANCDSTMVTVQPGFPPFVDFQICGIPLGSCDTLITCDTVRVTFNSTLLVNIQPTTPTICFGSGGTTISATGTGGTPPYTYLWDTGDTTQSIFVNAGTYIVELRDSAFPGCPPIYDTIVVSSFSSAIGIDAGTDQAACVQSFPINLSATVTAASGGTWFGGGGVFLPSADSMNTTYDPSPAEIASGSFDLFIVTTGNGSCPADTDSLNITIIQFSAIPTLSTSNISCFGDSNGTASVSVSGGVSPFTINWNAPISQTGPSVSGLGPGTYTVTISDSLGCDSTLSFTLIEPPNLLSGISKTDVNCAGGNDGSATVNVSGGTIPYTFQWDDPNNQTDSTATSLFAGIYNVTIADSNGCSDTLAITVTEPVVPLIITLSVVSVSCNGGNNGTANASVSGGQSPYTYLWNDANNQTNSTATGLVAGNYSVTVTDNNGLCMVDTNTAITQPATPLTLSTSGTNVTCNGGNNGAATAVAGGGTPPYSYTWNDPGAQSNLTATSLSAGIYAVTVTDNAGNCIIDSGLVITEPAFPLALNNTVTNVNCFGGSDATASILASGGTLPYTYLWNDPSAQTDSVATGLLAGTFSVTATDNNGCTALDTNIIITAPGAVLSAGLTSINVSCIGDSSGSVTALVLGGTPPYSYLWNDSTMQTTSSAIGLVPGIYQVFITDTNGCTLADSAGIIEPTSILTLAVTSSNATCNTASDGAATASAAGGIPPYTYLWDPATGNQDSATATGLTAGVYSIVMVDSFGCSRSDTSVVITAPPALSLDSISMFSGAICPGDTLPVSATYASGDSSFTYAWNTLGSGLGPFDVSPTSETYYVLTITDACANQVKDSIAVIINPVPIITLDSLWASDCVPLTVDFENQTPSPTDAIYLWSFSTTPTSAQAMPSFTFTSGLTYAITLTITSDKGCKTTSAGDSYVIAYPLPIVTCSAEPFETDAKNSTIDFSGGVNGLEYSWDFGDAATSNKQSPVHFYDTIGVYNVSLIGVDTNLCVNSCDLKITISPFYDILLPNAFTPNPNGSNGGVYDPFAYDNDVFFPEIEYAATFKMIIFNRWGEVVFVTDDLNIGWDGYYKGKLALQDTYGWKINVVFIDGVAIERLGEVTVIR
ncbi:MAG: gliding motility-associated C-terminal domain-containing protein [Flavobacteriales bacterium]|nr:gliding motility-associated C-terminal domain-containing protein [Flavobacteriales bacterium]